MHLHLPEGVKVVLVLLAVVDIFLLCALLQIFVTRSSWRHRRYTVVWLRITETFGAGGFEHVVCTGEESRLRPHRFSITHPSVPPNETGAMRCPPLL